MTTTHTQSDKAASLVLDNYAVPIEKKGIRIGKVINPTGEKLSMESDSSGLFVLDRDGYISLKKNAMLTDASPQSYEIVLKSGTLKKAFELVKDNFIRNKVIAHRGAWKNQDASQNSLKALDKAIEIGCEASEFDVWLSADNEVVLSHDPVIGGKKVEETTAKELYTIPLKDGDYLPSLVQYIERIKKQNKTRLVLEVKASQLGVERSKAVAEASVRMVHDMKAQAWVDYITFSFEAAERIRELDPSAKILYLEANKTLDEVKTAGMSGIDYHYSNFIKDAGLAQKARDKGLLTNAWTVNKEDDLRSMLGQGIDYITTDEPELLLNILGSR
ncbi:MULTISPECIES: glycerophosphodiester phosphodiesterase family protein [unclassified Dysgonomonas]|uniref:glycerophosphodiester phosphodiesterase family protein n=1 Tax=unclassified Dysgonomonas TaxID=2630389 RepID=UPI0024764DBF|nr:MULTISPECIES: glycerophosphodiester phosphodiesterase family protein [unclassified Dysgonomonas]